MIQFRLLFLFSILVQISNAQNWLTSGNSGITTSNFLGTTDNADLIFKTNSIERGKLFKTGAWRFGSAANNANIDVNGNLTFNGNAAYKVGGNKYAFQFAANPGYGLFFNQTNAQYEFRNGSALPVFVINANTGDTKINGLTVGRGGIDSTNTVMGYFAFFSNTTGKNNTAIGNTALNSNTTGNSNTASGYQALFSNNTGINNTASGALSLSANTNGVNNTASGVNALVLNTSGSYNTALGFTALHSNNGYSNTASGVQALYSNTSGSSNMASGVNALYNNTEGGSNTATGLQALYMNITGGNNTASGALSLQNNTTGNSNTAIGYSSGPASDNLSNSSAFGNLASTTASNQVRIGNDQVTSIGGYAGWTTLPSDGRVKKNIKENVPGLAFINKLKPLTYNLDLDAIENIIQSPETKTPDGKKKQPSQEELGARKQKEEIIYSGFIAQEVEKAAKALNYNFSGVDAAKNDKDFYGLRYAEFVVPLVKAVQELSQQNDDLQKRLAKLEAMVLSSSGKSAEPPSYTILSDAISLEQNIPNPFTNTTSIGYVLPQKFNSAKIIISDKTGKTLKAVTLAGKGKGTLQVDASTLASGAYNYSLYVDDKLIGIKQMISTK